MNPTQETDLKHAVITAVRAAGIRLNGDQESIIGNTLLPKVRQMFSGARSAGQPAERPPAALNAGLTRAEYEVLRLGALGITAADAAERAGVPVETLKSNRGRMYKKLGAHTMLAAVIHALRHDILTLKDLEQTDA